MRFTVCPYPGCGHEGYPLRGRELIRSKAVWLCEACLGRLPIKNPSRARRRRREEDR